ncbi:MAG: PEP-CTERM sorting domain-containing protein [Planctomycetota bacterium]
MNLYALITFVRSATYLLAVGVVSLVTNTASGEVFSQIGSPFVPTLVSGDPGRDSQFDTAPGVGENAAFATVYDNFTFSTDLSVVNFTWIGGYFFDDGVAPLASTFTVNVFGDDSGSPDLASPAIFTDTISSATLGESQFTAGGFVLREYSANVAPIAVTGGETYWFSAVANVAFADNSWAMAISDAPFDSDSFQGTQDLIVDPFVLNNDSFDYAFSVTAVPEPSSLACLAAILGLRTFRRRRRNS